MFWLCLSEKMSSLMRIYALVIVSLWSLSVGLIGMASNFGHRLPDRKTVFSTLCGNAQVYVLDWARLLSVNLTRRIDNSLYNLQVAPVWSSDGQKIAFVTNQDGNAEIYLTNLSSGTTRNISNHADDDLFPAWSPDSQHLAFNTRPVEGHPFISIVDVETGVIQMFPAIVFNSLVWSPDGQQIAFHGQWDDTAFNEDLLALNVATGEIRNLSNHPNLDEHPAWSPDSAQLVFTSRRERTEQLYRADLDTGIVIPISNSTNGEYMMPTWSPDSQWIAAVTNLYEIHIINLAGEIIRIPPPQNFNPIESLAWSQDGRYLLFSPMANLTKELYIFDTVSGNLSLILLSACGEILSS
jgi:TolB protein